MTKRQKRRKELTDRELILTGLNKAIAKGLRFAKTDGTLVQSPEELIAMEPAWNPKIGWHLPVNAIPSIGNN
jgi:hypothetical protein